MEKIGGWKSSSKMSVPTGSTATLSSRHLALKIHRFFGGQPICKCDENP
jgi:hypothetical protein